MLSEPKVQSLGRGAFAVKKQRGSQKMRVQTSLNWVTGLFVGVVGWGGGGGGGGVPINEEGLPSAGCSLWLPFNSRKKNGGISVGMTAFFEVPKASLPGGSLFSFFWVRVPIP